MSGRKRVKIILLNSSKFRSAGIEKKAKLAVRLIQFYLRQLLVSFGCGSKTFTLMGDESNQNDIELDRDFKLQLWNEEVDLNVDGTSVWRDLARRLVLSDRDHSRRKYLVIGDALCYPATANREEPLIAEGNGNLALIVIAWINGPRPWEI